MFDLGMQELIVIFIVALLVFGPKKLPELGRTLGKAMHDLKRAMEGVRDQIHTESEALKSMESHSEPEEKKEEQGASPGTAYPPLGDIRNPEQEKEKTDAGTVDDTKDAKKPEAGKEDKVDG
jgi:TatA/E family protein of Tat protein translocase